MPEEEIDIVAEAQVKHTESKEKVAKAISNLFRSSGDLRFEQDRVAFVSSERNSLSLLKDQFRDRRIRSAARRLLLSNQRELETTLLFNKQAATVGIAALCDDPSESPLGPIVLRINSQHLEQVIDWLTLGYDMAADTS
ncbi:MAG: RNA-binding domain-containing protein [Nitrososphaerales archaeon]